MQDSEKNCIEKCDQDLIISSQGNIYGETCDKISLIPSGFCNETRDENLLFKIILIFKINFNYIYY